MGLEYARGMNRKAIVAIVLLLGISAAIVVKNAATRVGNDDVAASAIRQYEIAKRGGNAMDAYFQAGLVAAAFLQAGDEENYRKWKDIERTDGRNAGVAVPASYADVERFHQSQDNKQFWAPLDQQRNAKPKQLSLPPNVATPSPEEIAAIKEAQEKSRLSRPPTPAPLPEPPRQTNEPTTYEKALAAAPYRKWVALGGKPASEAKIVGYDKDSGKITIEKRDGKTTVLRMTNLGKADKDYMQKWLDDAAL